MKKKWCMLLLGMALICSLGTGSVVFAETNTPDVTEAAAEESAAEKSDDAAEGLTYKRLVSVKKPGKHLKLGEYKGLELERVTEVITEEAIDSAIEYERNQHREGVNEAVEDGDIVLIDYVGIKDGEELDGSSAQGYSMQIEAGSVNEGLIGMTKGETREIVIPLPTENSEIPEDTTFRVTLSSISRVPELTDEWVAANTESKTVAEYREAMRKTLEEQAQVNADLLVANSAWEQLAADTEVKDYPEEDLTEAKEKMKTLIQSYADEAGMDFDAFLESQGYDEETYETMAQEYAENKVKQNLILQAVIDEEEIPLDDADMKACEDRLVMLYGAEDLAQLVSLYGEEEVMESVVMLRVQKFLTDHAEITESAAQGETVGVDTDAVSKD